MFIHMSLLLVFHYVDVMFGSYMDNRANDESVDIWSLLYVSWVGEVVRELGFSTLGRNHFNSCISCIDEIFGHHMVSTWRFINEDGHLSFQLEGILDILEKKLWSWACMTHCDRWGGLPYEDAIWREDFFCSIQFCSCLRTSNIFVGRTVIFPIFHKIIGILEFLIFIIN